MHEPAGRWREADASVHAVEHRSPQEILRFAQSAVRELTLGNEAAERALAVADMAAFGEALHLIDRASVDYDQAALAWDDVVCFHGTRGFDLPVKPERLQSVRLFGWDRRTPPVRGN